MSSSRKMWNWNGSSALTYTVLFYTRVEVLTLCFDHLAVSVKIVSTVSTKFEYVSTLSSKNNWVRPFLTCASFVSTVSTNKNCARPSRHMFRLSPLNSGVFWFSTNMEIPNLKQIIKAVSINEKFELLAIKILQKKKIFF